KFSYKNLAQIKFILPEAVQTEKILLHNNKTLSVEHDIKVALNFDVVEGHIEHSDYMALSHAFSRRLFKLVNKHSEVFDVPEAELPEPFNQREIIVSAPALPVDSSNIAEAELLNPSHLLDRIIH
nr:CDT1-like protein a, chloroplastic [Tanacetum cinerariifolium]